MDGREQQREHRRQQSHQPPFSQPIYGYGPVNPSWGQHPNMHHPMPVQTGVGYHLPIHHMEGVPLPPGIPGLGGSTDPLEAVLGPFPCTRLRNLPFDATLEDILVLFQGLVVLDVVLVGQGDAFVIFANPMDFQMALQRDRQTLGRRFVEIFQGSRAEYYEAIANQHMQEQQRDIHALKGDKGAVGVKEQSDLAAVWGSAALAPVQVLATQQQGQAEDAQHQPPPAVPLGGRGTAGIGRPVQAPLVKRTGGGIQVGEHTGFLRMRGLPFSSTKDDIFKFFDGYNPIADRVVLTYRSDGRATGEAYVGFESPDDSKKAMELHRNSMGSRYIELFISNKEEHGRALARFGNR